MTKKISLLVIALFVLIVSPGLVQALPQSIELEGVGNARELGGYVTKDGLTVKHGVLLRTAELAGATSEDIKRLKEDFKLGVIIDFRTTLEAKHSPELEIEGVKNLLLLIIDEEAAMKKIQSLPQEELKGLDLSDKFTMVILSIKTGFISDQLYIDFLSGAQGKESYRIMFRELLDLPEGRGFLFHCRQGKDRTGCAAMLILSALGVDEETIMKDFLLTNDFNAKLIEQETQMLHQKGIEGEEFEQYIAAMDKVDPQYMLNALNWMKDTYGSVTGYITKELGVTPEEIELLKNKYLE